MKNRIIICLLLSVLLLCRGTGCHAYASDAEVETDETVAEYEFFDKWSDLKQYISEGGLVPEDAAVVNALYLNYRKLDTVYFEMRTVSALLLILVVFETLRIARAWSKEVGLK